MFLHLLSPLLSTAVYAFDIVEPIALWATVGVVAALLVVGIVLFFAKRTAFPAFVKYGGFGFLCYALALGITMLVLNIVKRASEDYLTENYVSGEVVTHVLIPLLCLCILTLIFGVVLFFLSKSGVKKQVFTGVGIAFGVILAVCLIIVGILVGGYYFKNINGDGYYNSDTASVNQILLYVLAGGLILLAVGGALLFGRKEKFAFDSRCIALAGVCIAMSFALSYIKLFKMPQGGSVTLVSLLPLMIFSYAYGVKKGVLAGFVYGILQAAQDPYIIHPAQFLLDYPIAFALVGFAGLFASIRAIRLPQVRFVLGGVLASVLRFVSHVFSGVFAFAAYAGESNVWAYSLAYNSFVFVDIALVLVAGVFVFSSKALVQKLEDYPVKLQTKDGVPTS